MSSLINLEHTPESVRGKLYDACIKNPGTSIEDLLRTAAHQGSGLKNAATLPIADVLRALADKPDALIWPAVLGMVAGNMAGDVEANVAEAKALAERILFKLTESGKAMNKDEMAAAVLPGVNLKQSPQHAADFKEALSLLNDNPQVIRRTSKGEIATKRWDTMQFAKPPKPASK